jgi:hypothetical protein
MELLRFDEETVAGATDKASHTNYGSTFTRKLELDVSLPPWQERVKSVSPALDSVIAREPCVASWPVHAPPAVQPAAFFEVQLSVVAPPTFIECGDAFSTCDTSPFWMLKVRDWSAATV